MRKSWKTTEFWVGLVAVALAAIWPDFPQEGLLAVGTWVAGRITQKTFGETSGGERAWMTSEFWVAIAFVAASYIFPEIPTETFSAVVLWVSGRSAVKIFKDFKVSTIK